MCGGAARRAGSRSATSTRVRERYELSGARSAPSPPRRRQRNRDPARLWQRSFRQQGRAARRQPLPDDRRGYFFAIRFIPIGGAASIHVVGPLIVAVLVWPMLTGGSGPVLAKIEGEEVRF